MPSHTSPKKFLIFFIFAFYVATLCACVLNPTGQKETVGKGGHNQEELAPPISKAIAILRESLKDPKFSGAIAASHNGHLIFSDTVGYANRENLRKNTVQTKFGIASSSKMITAAAVLTALESVGLTLESPISSFFESQGDPVLTPEVTAGNLLSHHTSTSEIWDLPDSDMLVLRATNNNDLFKLAAKAQTTPITSVTDENASYNNTGFIIAAELVERISGESFEQYVANNLFGAQKKLPVAFSRESRSEFEGLAIGYIPVQISDSVDQEFKRSDDPLSNAISNGAGGVYITAEDLVLFIDWFAKSEKSSMRKKLCTPLFETGLDKYYGYGCSLWMHKDNIIRLGHSGGAPGVSASITHYPNHNLSVSILSNVHLGTKSIIGNIDKALGYAKQ